MWWLDICSCGNKSWVVYNIQKQLTRARKRNAFVTFWSVLVFALPQNTLLLCWVSMTKRMTSACRGNAVMRIELSDDKSTHTWQLYNWREAAGIDIRNTLNFKKHVLGFAASIKLPGRSQAFCGLRVRYIATSSPAHRLLHTRGNENTSTLNARHAVRSLLATGMYGLHRNIM